MSKNMICINKLQKIFYQAWLLQVSLNKQVRINPMPETSYAIQTPLSRLYH